MKNPLVQHEFFGILRTRRALAVLATLSFAFSVLVLLRWPSDAVVDLSGAQARLVFQVFGYGLMLGVLFLIPAFPAASIVREKNRGTLALLFNSPLRSWQIYFGKFAGVFLFSLLLLLTSLPAAAGCYAMGGIELFGELGLLYLVLLLMTVQYVALALLVSSLVQSTDAAVRMTYAWVFAISFLSLGPNYLFQGQTAWPPMVSASIPQFLQIPGFGALSFQAASITSDWLWHLSPVPVLMRIVGHGDFGSQGLMSSAGPGRFFSLGLLSTSAFAAWTILRMNHRMFDRSRDKGIMTEERSVSGRAFRRIAFIVDPQRRKSGIPWFLNPVLVKEFRCRRFGRSHWLLRMIFIITIVSLLLTFATTLQTENWGTETIGGLMVLLQVVLVILITPSLAAGLISTERESGGWELLRMTPLSTFKILRGKLLSVVWTLVLVLAATLPGYLVMYWIKPVMWLQISQVLVCLLLTALMTMSVSALVSSLFRRTATATTSCYIVLMVLFLGPMLIWLAREAPFGHNTVEAILLINPMGAALSAMEAPGFTQYALMPAAWYVAGFVSVGLLLSLAAQVWRLNRPA